MQKPQPYVNFGEFHRDDEAAQFILDNLDRFYRDGYRTLVLEFYQPNQSAEEIERNLTLKMADILEVRKRAETSFEDAGQWEQKKEWCEGIIHSTDFSVLEYKDGARGKTPLLPPNHYELLTQYRHTRAHLALVVAARERDMNVVGANVSDELMRRCNKLIQEAVQKGDIKKPTDRILILLSAIERSMKIYIVRIPNKALLLDSPVLITLKKSQIISKNVALMARVCTSIC